MVPRSYWGIIEGIERTVRRGDAKTKGQLEKIEDQIEKGKIFVVNVSNSYIHSSRMNEDQDEEVSQDDVIDQKLQDAETPWSRLILMRLSGSRSAKTLYRTRTLVTVPSIFSVGKKEVLELLFV